MQCSWLLVCSSHPPSCTDEATSPSRAALEECETPSRIAGSGLVAARHLKFGLPPTPTRKHWDSKPSVGTWLQYVPAPLPLKPRHHSVRQPSVWRRAPSIATWLQARPSSVNGRELHQRVPPQMWCVTKQDLDAFVELVREMHTKGLIPKPAGVRSNPYHDNPDIGPNMHSVNEHVIIPRTLAAGGMSWALMVRPNGLPVGRGSSCFFVTHSWAEGVYEFHRRVTRSWPDGVEGMWCCFLANPQAWKKNELQELLGGEPLADSPFARALRASRQLLVVPNSTQSIYTRLWCVAEAKLAIDLGIPVNLATDADASQQSSLDRVSADSQNRGLSVLDMSIRDVSSYRKGLSARHAASEDLVTDFETVKDAKCSDPDDERRIRAAIRGEEDAIDDLIRQLREQGHFYPVADGESRPISAVGSMSLSRSLMSAAASPVGCRLSASNVKDDLLFEIAALSSVARQ